MKKLLALLLALGMIFVFVACGQSEEQQKLNQTLGDLEDATENGDLDDITDAMDDVADAMDDAGATLNMDASEIVSLIADSSDFKNEIATLEAQGLTCKIVARNNYLVYSYSFTIEIADIDGAKTAADAGEAGYKALANSLMKIYSGIDGVIIEYATVDGEVFATYKYDK